MIHTVCLRLPRTVLHTYACTHFQYYLIDYMFFCCSAGSFYQGSFYEYFRVRVDHTGLVDWSFGGPLQITCPMDTTLYPFDRQRCSLILENWAYGVDYVDLRNSSDNLQMNDHHDSGRVLISSFNQCLNRNMRVSASSWTVVIRIERRLRARTLLSNNVCPSICHDPALCQNG